ncbi:MAG TPA: tetratricopeptide repeat protein [Candidatus Obscuribacterales bacterium]
MRSGIIQDLRHTASTVCAFALLALLICCPAALSQTSKLNQMQSREHVNRGNVCLNRRQFQEALDEYQKAIDLDPTNAVARNNIVQTHLNWGAVNFAQNKFDEALAEWETVLKLDPYNQNAKHNINVLKQTLARRCGALQAKPPGEESAAKPAQPKSDPAVVILTPGIKQSQASGASGESKEETQAAPASEAAAAETPAESTSERAAPVQPAVGASPAGSIEDQLSALELKIYGHKQAEMTVLKRLEKMEMDTAGQVRTGTIKERIDALKKSYGL